MNLKPNSAIVHCQLFKCRKQPGESSRQYVYVMQEIADQGHIEEDAIIQYIIDGIPDDECNKTMLYDASTLRELKKYLEVYDRIKEKGSGERRLRRKIARRMMRRTQGVYTPNDKQLNKKHCFNCGSTEHDVKSCDKADKEPKCFKCNSYGHIASKCTQTQAANTSTTTVNCVNSTSDKFILIHIEGQECHALVDTGSDVNLLRNDLYEKIGKPELSSTTRIFTGLGNTSTKPNGTCHLQLSMGNDVYEVKVYVVPTRSMTSELILGCDFLKISKLSYVKAVLK